MTAGQRTLNEAFPGRFLLGIGFSHRPIVEGLRGHAYGLLAEMRTYLDAMDAAPYVPPRAAEEPRVLAALGPKMLALASRDRAAGAHPYFVPVEHTRRARDILGQGPLLAPELAVVSSVIRNGPARLPAATRCPTSSGRIASSTCDASAMATT